MKRRFGKFLTFCLVTVMLIHVLPFTELSLTVYASSNEELIFDFIKNDMNANTAVACGVIANIKCESSFNPTASCVDTNGLTSYGICQWNGGRFENLKSFCSERGYNYQDINAQLLFLKYELEGSKNSAWCSINNQPNTSDGAYEAGYNWARYFEVCSHYYNGVDQWSQRATSARDTYWPKYAEDTIAPQISNIQFTNDGVYYKISCTVSDNNGVVDVKFPTWTENNGQDDLIWHEGTLIGDTAYCYIYKSDHNNESGKYITHIYAYDEKWNESSVAASTYLGTLTICYDCYTYPEPTINSDNTFYFGDYNRICTTQGSFKEMDGTGNVYCQTLFYGNQLKYGGLHDFGDFGLVAPNGYRFVGWKSGDNQKVFAQDVETYVASDFVDDISKSDRHVWLTAQFEPITATITFDANGGECSTNNKTVTYNSEYGTLPVPTRTGYIFDGWYTSASGGSIVTEENRVSITTNQTLYAHWTINNLTVTFDANGGECSTNNKTVTYNSEYGTLPIPIRTGYTFDGWYTSASDGTIITEKTIVFCTSAQTLYAHWTINSLTVTFDANGGECSTNNKTVTYNSEYGVLPVPTRAGYTFNGWYTSKDDGTTITEDMIVYTIYDQTLYAHWIENIYSIIFDANGGECSTISKTVTYSSLYGTLPIPVRLGYTFDGWYTSKDDGTTITEDMTVYTTYDQTLYAHWIENSYIVNFNCNGGDCSISSKTVKYNAKYGTLPTPTLRFYKFDGWYTSLYGGSKISANSLVSITSDQILYAHWVENSYTITFDGNGGNTETCTEKVTIGDSFTISDKVPVRERFIFDGWYTNQYYTGTQYLPNDTINIVNDITFYAKWKVDPQYNMNPRIYAERIAVSDADDIVQIPVYIENNCGLSGFKLFLDYNCDIFEPVSTTKSSLLTEGYFIERTTDSNGTIKITWSNSKDFSEDGELFVVKFRVKKHNFFGSDIEITYSQEDTFNMSWEEVTLDCEKIGLSFDGNVISTKENYNVVINNNYIYGLNAGAKSLDDYIEIADCYEVRCLTKDNIGTNTTINIYEDAVLKKTYTIVIFGDVNGDGWYDGTDSIIVNCLANGMLTREQVGEAVYMASDCNHDGVIDQLDVEILKKTGLLLASIDQTKSAEELETSSAYQEYLNLIDQSPVVEKEDTTQSDETPTEKEPTFFETLWTILMRIFEFFKSYLVTLK